MDKDFLFKGKSAETDEWVEGYYLKCHLGDTYIAVVTEIPFADFDFIPVISSSVELVETR